MADFALPTERLVLREWRDDDVPASHAICADRQVMAYLGPPNSIGEVIAGIARQRAFQQSHGYCFWAIERREDSALLGFCGIKPGPEGTPLHGQPEIGWRLRSDSWGKGYAREAAQASIAWGFANLTDPTLLAMTVLANTRSWGLMERLGMTRRHDLDFDHPAVPDGDPLRPHIVYALDRADVRG